jgi:hypothetical protein
MFERLRRVVPIGGAANEPSFLAGLRGRTLLDRTEDNPTVDGQRLKDDIEAGAVVVLERGANRDPEVRLPLAAGDGVGAECGLRGTSAHVLSDVSINDEWDERGRERTSPP